MDADDLLQSYARTGDDSIFTRFVERCSGMVYGIAQRQLGDPSAAEEVSQNVFLLVAKKSKSLAARRGILAWLQRSTILEVKNRRRHEAARRRRLERFAKHNEEDIRSDGGDDSGRLASLADIALSRLPSQDRQVVLLRYYEDRTYGEISEITGKEEPALRKQMSRALKRMEQWCREGCPQVSGTALVAALSLMASDRAPAAMVAAISARLEAGTALGLAGNLPYVSVFSTLALVSVIAVPLLAIQQQRLGQHPPGPAEVVPHEPIARSSLVATAETDRELRELRPLRSDEAVEDPVRFAKALLHAHGLSMSIRGEAEEDPPMAMYPHNLGDILLAQASLLDSPKLLRLIDEVVRLRGLARSKKEIADSLIEILGRNDPEGALELAGRDGRPEVLKKVLFEWCERDVDAAAVWIAELKTSDSRLPLELEIQIQSALCQALVAMDPDQAVRLALPYIPKDLTGEFRRQLTRKLAYHREHGAFLTLATSLSTSEDGLEELLTDYAEDAFGNMSMKATGQPPLEGARELFDHPSFPPDFRNRALIAAVTEPNMNLIEFTFPAVIELSPPKLVESNLRIVIRRFVSWKGLSRVKEWHELEVLAPYRDDLLAEAVRGISRRDPDMARAWISQIHDEELRNELSMSLTP